jgi:tetratricopeptide (TPR) repeat protein
VSQQRRWIIKNAEGVLKGPISTEEVLKRISRGDISGDELISEYPGANWYPISQDPEFYDRLLEALSRQAQLPPPEEPREMPLSNALDEEAQSRAAEVTPTPALNQEQDSQTEPIPEMEVDEDRTAPMPPPKSSSSRRSESERRQGSRSSRDRKSRRGRRGSSRRASGKDDVIELVDTRQRVKKEVLKTAWKPAVVAAVILLAGFYLLFSGDGPREEERIHLLAPQKGRASITPEQAKAKTSRGAAEYLRDSYSGYNRAQNELVQAAEGNEQNPEVLAMLCMTYYELWPFAYQDSADIKVISQVTQAVSAIDGGGMHSSTCKVIDLILKGRYDEAKSLSVSTLETVVTGGQPPIPFYYFMAILSDAGGDAKTAIGYLSTAQQLWPQWLKVFVYQAQLQAKAGNYTEAARIYRQVLQASPGHDVAKIELGILEYKHFRNPVKGAELILAGVQSKDRVIKRVLSRGYFGLAEIALQKRDSHNALDFARKAYAEDSTNSLAKNLVIQLGGSKALSKTRFKSYQLIAEGDQFFREGDCNSAQAHYKAAYEVDQKSAVAAMKAGECLWRLSLSTEAIEWLNKAIRADPNLIEAYVALADYYSQRYNFVAAAQVLIGAQKVAPRSYEAYRGFALIELRRNNPKAAVDYAKQALAIYDTDVESHVIMAEALLELGAAADAFAHATKAREIDVNHRRAQAVYGRALGGVRGTEAAVDFFAELVKTYPLVNEYRLALGRQLLDDERYGEAEKVFLELTQIDDKSKEAFLRLGKVLRVQARYEDALNALLKAAVLDPSDAEPLFQAGLLYLEINKPEEARIQFQRVLRINKLFPLVHYHLGRAALLTNDANLALQEAKEERAVNPNLAEAYLLAADAYTQLQQYSLCVAEYQKALKLRPQSAEIYLKVSQCYRKADQLDTALAMLNQAAEKESGRPDIYRELGIIYEAKGEIAKAVEAYNQYFALNPNAEDRVAIEKRIISFGRK